MKVIEFSAEPATHFEQINRSWIEAYFEMEPMDEELLLNPQREIIDKGGDLLFVEENDQIVGTVALKDTTMTD